MAALQEGSPSPSSSPAPCGCSCTTPPRMAAAAPKMPAAPTKEGSKKKYNYMVKLVLDSVDELHLKFMEEERERQNSEEALEALRKKKIRILKSMR